MGLCLMRLPTSCPCVAQGSTPSLWAAESPAALAAVMDDSSGAWQQVQGTALDQAALRLVTCMQVHLLEAADQNAADATGRNLLQLAADAGDALLAANTTHAHLTHMPSHAYVRVGRYVDAVQVWFCEQSSCVHARACVRPCMCSFESVYTCAASTPPRDAGRSGLDDFEHRPPTRMRRDGDLRRTKLQRHAHP